MHGVEPARAAVIGKAMFKRIKQLLAGGDAWPGAAVAPRAGDELQVAAAALLVEAALMDDRFEASERAKITELLRARFGLGAADAEALLEAAREQVGRSSQLFGFTRVVADRFAHDERVELMEMLWQVAYADGRLDDYEANLMRRLAGLIHVSDRDSGEARKRAIAHLGLEP
jgi:uncharacterized tellurite resistance protein B-like protein